MNTEEANLDFVQFKKYIYVWVCTVYIIKGHAKNGISQTAQGRIVEGRYRYTSINEIAQ